MNHITTKHTRRNAQVACLPSDGHGRLKCSPPPYLAMYPLVHTLTRSLTHSLTYSLTRSLTCVLTHSFTHPLTHPLIHTRTHVRTHTHNNSLTQPLPLTRTPPTRKLPRTPKQKTPSNSLRHQHSPQHLLAQSALRPLCSRSLTQSLPYSFAHSLTHSLKFLVCGGRYLIAIIRISRLKIRTSQNR